MKPERFNQTSLFYRPCLLFPQALAAQERAGLHEIQQSIRVHLRLFAAKCVLARRREGGVLLLAGVFGFGLAGQAREGRADTRYNPEALQATQRIAIVTPFFCTHPPPEPVRPPATIRKQPAAKQADGKPVARVVLPNNPTPRKPTRTSAANTRLQPARVRIEPAAPVPTPADSLVPRPSTTAPTSTEKAFYPDALKSLTATLQTALPDSLTAGEHYRIVPAADTRQALRALHWQPQDLYIQRGKPNNNRFPLPDSVRIQQLARRLHVDAVLVTAMREPASVGDGIRLPFELWKINPLNLNVRRMRPHVLSPRVQAFLITAQGVTAWQDEQMADHPRTNPHTLKTLLIDWQEATEQVAQQLADSLKRGSTE